MVNAHSLRSEGTNEELLKIIKKAPGLSKYELALTLKWTIGKVDGSIHRLLEEKKVYIKVIERAGRQVNLIYPSDKLPINDISISEKKLEVGNPLWQNEAYIYALDMSTIGIAGNNITEWNDVSCFQEKINLIRNKGMISFQIPERFKRFYRFNSKHIVVTINSNNLLITVSGNIIDSVN